MRYQIPVSVLPPLYTRCYIRIWVGRHAQVVTSRTFATNWAMQRVQPKVQPVIYLQRFGTSRSGDTNLQRTLCVGIIQTLIAQADNKQHLPEDLSPWVSVVL